MNEDMVINTMGLIIAGLIGSFLSTIFSNKKYITLVDKLDNLDRVLIRVDAKLNTLDSLKEEVDEMYGRLRELETIVAVMHSKINKQ